MSERSIQRRPVSAGSVFSDTMPALLQRLYSARRIVTETDVYNGLDALCRPDLKGLPKAVELLAGALRQGEEVLVVGDYDADGATSTALMVRALRAFGAERVGYLVPNRFRHGYGLTPQLVELAGRRAPDLIVTVDNGAASVKGVAAARKIGITTLITDHHLPGEVLPAADAMVNPNQPGCPFPSKALAGVGVVFYLLSALRAHLVDQGWFAAEGIEVPRMARWLDLVAFGTIADLVPLDRNNRILVSQGLARIRAGACVEGITALARVAGRDRHRLFSRDVAFNLAPRLNAAGRLEDMSIGIECLLADDPESAGRLAEQLDAINRQRRVIESDMQASAERELERWEREAKRLPTGVCLYDPGWHEGVIGILAARVRQRVHRPTVVFAPASEGMLRGSARSIPEVHVRDVLAAVDAAEPGLLERFGGHAMAAGLSLHSRDLSRFSKAFDYQVKLALGSDTVIGVTYSDGPLSGEELSLETALLLQDSGPWGQGFPEPTFDGVFEVTDSRVLQDRHLRLWLWHEDASETLEAIAFNAERGLLDRAPERVRIVYRLEPNEYRGRRRLQLLVEHLEKV